MDAQIIDLAEIAAVCGPLADWWNKFMTTGEPRLPELEHARRSLRRLTAAPGAVGRAVRQLDAVRDQPDPAELMESVELLCKLAAHHAQVRTAPRSSRRPARSPSGPHASAPTQLRLPGLG